MKYLYLALAVLGTVVPYVFFVEHFAATGLSPLALLAAAFANPGAAGFTADLLIASAAFWVYLFSHREHASPWPFVVMNLVVGLSLALPAYLYLRARAAEARPAGNRAGAPITG